MFYFPYALRFKVILEAAAAPTDWLLCSKLQKRLESCIAPVCPHRDTWDSQVTSLNMRVLKVVRPCAECKVPRAVDKGESLKPALATLCWGWERFLVNWKFPGGSVVKNLPAMQETQVWFLGWEDPLRRKWQPTAVFLARKIPWTEEPGRLQSIESQRVGHDWAHTPTAWLHVPVSPHQSTLLQLCYSDHLKYFIKYFSMLLSLFLKIFNGCVSLLM